MLHMSEVSNRVKPSMAMGANSELIKVGQTLDVKCIGVDLLSGTIKLSRKQLLDENDRPLQVGRDLCVKRNDRPLRSDRSKGVHVCVAVLMGWGVGKKIITPYC